MRKPKKIVINEGVKEIGFRAFYQCNALEELYIPASVELISDAFVECENLKTVRVSPQNKFYDSRENCNAVIDSKTNEIVVSSSQMVVPESVCIMKEAAFANCKNLKEIYIPKDVTELEYWHMSRMENLEKIVVDSKNPVYDSRNNCNAIIEPQTNTLVKGSSGTVFLNDITKIAASAFENNKKIIDMIIPSNISEIGMFAFAGCSNLKSIVLPDDLEIISAGLFSECTELSSVHLPANLKIIDIDGEGDNWAAFYNCKSLKELMLPSQKPGPTIPATSLLLWKSARL